MKIGLVRRGYSPAGGAESYLRRLAAGLEAAGNRCVLFASPQWPESERLNGEFRAVAGRSPAAFADNLAALRPGDLCDVVFSLERVWQCDCYRAGDGVHRAWLERRARLEPGWRSLWRSWNPKHRQLLALEAALFAPGGARTVIANSRLVAGEIVAAYGCAPERITVIYNGLPAASFHTPDPDVRKRKRAALALAEDDYVILFAGSGWERKGLSCVISALEHLPDAPRPRLLVAGRGDANAYRRKLSKRTAGRVRFLGTVSDMPAHYAAADLFVLPTRYDPFSNACLEALAAGLPVITTVHNGFAEVIAPGVDGEVLPPAGEAGRALAGRLAKWSDRELRKGTLASRIAKAAAFTIESNVERTLRVIMAARE